jgi:hypothetical protein
MNKKIVFSVGLIIILIVAGVYIFIIKPRQVTPLSQIVPAQPTTKPQVETAQWIDQSEFRFDYPKNLTVNPHEEDQINYAHVELTDAQHPGRITVWTKDTNSKTIDEWWKAQTYDGVIDTTLGGEPAKKVLIPETPSKILTSAIRNGYLYQVEVELADEPYWNDIYNQIISSFTFFSAETPKNDSLQINTAPPASFDIEEETIE